MADLGRFLQTTALAQEQEAFGRTRAQQIHDRRRVRRADTEVDDRQPVGVGRRLHRFVGTSHLAVEPLREPVDILLEVGQEDVVTELIQIKTGGSLQAHVQYRTFRTRS